MQYSISYSNEQKKIVRHLSADSASKKEIKINRQHIKIQVVIDNKKPQEEAIKKHVFGGFSEVVSAQLKAKIQKVFRPNPLIIAVNLTSPIPFTIVLINSSLITKFFTALNNLIGNKD